MQTQNVPGLTKTSAGPSAFVPFLFLFGAVLGAIGCLGRADYNLPVFLFAYIAWNYLKVFEELIIETQIHRVLVIRHLHRH